MIDVRYQGNGFGRRALEQVIEYVRKRPRAENFILGCVEGEGSAVGFYESMGFHPTGEIEEGEAFMKLDLV